MTVRLPGLEQNSPYIGSDARVVVDRSISSERSIFRLSDGTIERSRRYLPLGRDDIISGTGDTLAVLAKRDDTWISIGAPWSKRVAVDLAGIPLSITFKEIDSAAELQLFQQLRQFHYRGGGGAGRTLPLIGTVDVPDLPRVIGFVELTSAMIANTARKRFFDGPYREADGLGWGAWDRATSRNLSSLICRISRFVIHPELRGLGLARHFSKAAIEFARERWHYGGYRPRFLEITADMLRYYPFVGDDFVFIGETEGNGHRVSKDMSYLVRRALSDEGVKAMPQGGGGIMSLQRGYATTLLGYIQETGASLEGAVAQLRFDPSKLDQVTWEKLHRLNRRPKPCYVAGLSDPARSFIKKRKLQVSANTQAVDVRAPTPVHAWSIRGLGVHVEADILQSRDGRLLQDAFGFVGSGIRSIALPALDMAIVPGEIVLVCGASGSGKSMLLAGITRTLLVDGRTSNGASAGLQFTGVADRPARVGVLRPLDAARAPLDLIGSAPLSKFLKIAAQCGLAEPQLLVRPIWTLSSGQQYRLQIALALLSEPEILLIDNFCESLDRFSTRAVCKGLAATAAKHNIAMVVATAAYDRLADCIVPDQLIVLRRGDEPVVQRGARIEI